MHAALRQPRALRARALPVVLGSISLSVVRPPARPRSFAGRTSTCFYQRLVALDYWVVWKTRPPLWSPLWYVRAGSGQRVVRLSLSRSYRDRPSLLVACQRDVSLRHNRTVTFKNGSATASINKPYVWVLMDGYPTTEANYGVRACLFSASVRAES
jgi:hypothetical protein